MDINLTDITATRLNGNYVSLSFQSDTTGEYAYLITTKSGAPTEEEWNAANRVDMLAGENGLGKDNVTGAKCYLHLMAWDNDGNPMANPPAATEISANPISAGFDAIDEDGFANLPFSSAFSPGDDPTDIYQVETGLGNRYPVSARLMKLQLEAKETVLLECYDDVENGYPNYRIHVYTNEGPDYSLIDESDNDNGESAYGEATYFTAPSEGVYYIAIFCNDPDVVNGVDPRSATVKASKVATEDAPLTLKQAIDKAAAFDADLSETITFGGDDTVFCFNDLGVSGLSRFYAATLAKGDLIELSMTGKNVTLDCEMSIYQKNGSGSYERVVRTTALETPYLNFYPREAGDYVFAFSNMRKGASGSADISLKRLNETVADRFEAFEALELSEVPLKETFDYHDASLYNREFGEEFPNRGKLLKLDMIDGQALELKIDGDLKDKELLELMIYNDENFQQIGWHTGSNTWGINNLRGTVYVWARLYTEGTYTLTANVIDQEDYVEGGIRLPDDASASGNRWSWDDKTRTLTLKDGFVMYAFDREDGFTFPSGDSTVVVEGSAKIFSDNGNGLVVDWYGDLTIKGSKDSSLMLSKFPDVSDGSLIIESGSVTVEDSNPINTTKLVVKEDADLTLTSPEGGMTTAGNTFTVEGDCNYLDVDGNLLYGGPWDPEVLSVQNNVLYANGKLVADIKTGHVHVFDQKNTDDTYFKAPASCISPAEYYYSCTCGEKGTVKSLMLRTSALPRQTTL